MSLIWAIFRQRIYPELNGGISVKWKMIFLNDEAFLKLLCSLLSSIKVHFHINQNSVAKNKINLSQFKHRGIQNWALNSLHISRKAEETGFRLNIHPQKQDHQTGPSRSCCLFYSWGTSVWKTTWQLPWWQNHWHQLIPCNGQFLN